ncbi:MAG: DUF2851 family protein [Bacteroidota bacterium]
MQEDLLHFIWKYKKFPHTHLRTTKDEPIHLVHLGTHNYLAGPDFLNARIGLGNQMWAGNVEIHVKSSDWYAHGHEGDTKYNNVILHVVWEHDMPVYRKDKEEIATLELKNYVPQSLLVSYNHLLDKQGKQFINCEREIRHVDTFVVVNWLERLYFERLERKAREIEEELVRTKNNWEQVLFILLLKNVGSPINKDAFSSLANALDFSIVRKIQDSPFKLESVFFGLSGLLEETHTDTYYLELQREYNYLENKFGLDSEHVLRPDFFKLRPPNFPTVRLSQLASIYGRHANLFAKVMQISHINEYYDVFQVAASAYWDNHYTFGRESKKNKKRLTKNFIDLLLINTVFPLKFCYNRYRGNNVNMGIIPLISQLKAERNRIVDGFKNVGFQAGNAMESQSALQLYTAYCAKNRCLHCAVGGILVRGASGDGPAAYAHVE